VDDGAARALQRFEGAADQRLARLRQHLDGDVGGDQVLVDQLAHEVEFHLRGRGEADLDLLEADLHQRWNMRSLRGMSIGSISAWLPSRRSTLHHTGGFVSTASGQVRSARRTGRRGGTWLAGFFNIGMVISLGG
jgi:hypothetical protein